MMSVGWEQHNWARRRGAGRGGTETPGLRVVPPEPAVSSGPDLAILESVPHVVWVCRPDGATEYVNRRGLDLLGLDAASTSDMGWLRLVHPEDQRAASAACANTGGSGE